MSEIGLGSMSVSPFCTLSSDCVQDLDNTVGAWDMYGQEDTKRYPDMQNEFFERAAGGLASRGSMLRFCAVGAQSFPLPQSAAI